MYLLAIESKAFDDEHVNTKLNGFLDQFECRSLAKNIFLLQHSGEVNEFNSLLNPILGRKYNYIVTKLGKDTFSVFDDELALWFADKLNK